MLERPKHTWDQVTEVIEQGIALKYHRQQPVNQARWDAYAWVASRHSAAAYLMTESPDDYERETQAEIYENSKIPLHALKLGEWRPLQRLLEQEALALARSGGEFSKDINLGDPVLEERIRSAMLEDLRFGRSLRNLAQSLGNLQQT